MSAPTHVCVGAVDPAIADCRRAERALLRREVLEAITAGPATAAEVRARIGPRPWRMTVHCQLGCQWLADEVFWNPFPQNQVQRELVRLERIGATRRLVIPGWQAHLWMETRS